MKAKLGRFAPILIAVLLIILEQKNWLNQGLIVRVLIWGGIAISMVHHLMIIGGEFVFTQEHKRMSIIELVSHLAASIILFFCGLVLVRVANSVVGTIAAIWCVLLIVKLDSKTRPLVSSLLRHRIKYLLATNHSARAKTLSHRLFDVMIIERLGDKSKEALLTFAKSALTLAEMRETMGDYTQARMLYGWAMADFLKARLTKRNEIRADHMAPLIDAVCGNVRVSEFLGPSEAARELDLLQSLAKYCTTPELAAKVVMVGGEISPSTSFASSVSGDTISEAILKKNAIVLIGYRGVPQYREAYAAFILAKSYASRGRTREALQITERLSGHLGDRSNIRDFFLWLKSEQLRSSLLEQTGDYEPARKVLSSLINATEYRLEQLGEGGNERELRSLSERATGLLRQLVGLIAERFGNHSESVDSVFKSVIRVKGIAAWFLLNVSRALSTEVKDDFRKEAAKAASLRGQVAAAWTESNRSVRGFDLSMLELERLEAFLIEKRIGRSWTSLRDENDDSVRKCLTLGERLFEFVRATFAGEQEHYVVFSMSDDQTEKVRLIDIGTASDLDAAILEWRNLVQLGSNPGPQQRVTSYIQTHLIDPLLNLMNGATRIITATDGALAYLPFEAFFDRDGRRLVEKYEWIYVSTCKEILGRRNRHFVSVSQPVVVAAPDYEWSRETTNADTRTIDDRSAKPGGLFGALKFAEQEGREVAELTGAQLLLGREANVSEVKKIRRPIILHVATHAFAFDESAEHQDAIADEEGPKERWDKLKLAEEPTVRAGLALAGINAAYRGLEIAPECDDGVLSALEASALDLAGTELVVLSACDTGRGQLHRGEGVVGLRRALVIAGARTQLISLWRVPDEQTCDLMISFYKGVSEGMTFEAALRCAKLEIIQTHPQPLYWAAFVCCGTGGGSPGRVVADEN